MKIPEDPPADDEDNVVADSQTDHDQPSVMEPLRRVQDKVTSEAAYIVLEMERR